MYCSKHVSIYALLSPCFDSNVTIAANVFTASSDLVRLYNHVVPCLIYAVQLLEKGKQLMCIDNFVSRTMKS